MRQLLLLVTLTAAAICATGCTSSGRLSGDFYQPRSIIKNQIKGDAAFDNDSSFFDTIEAEYEAVRIVLYTDAGLREAIATAIGEYFSPDTHSAGGSFLISGNLTTMSSGRNVSLELILTISDRATGRIVYEEVIRDSTRLSYTAVAAVADFTSGFTLGMATPVTIPLRTMNLGADSRNRLRKTLSSMIDSGFRGILRNRSKLETRRTRLRSANPPALPSRSLPTSRFDTLLDAVIVIRSGGRQGSGFFVSENGLAVTNYHVVENNRTISVSLRDGRTADARVVAISPENDLALLQVPIARTTWLPLANLEAGSVGTDVVAAGAPKGLSWSVSRGIISSLRPLDDGTLLVQTDAPVNPGSSGGPLVLVDSGLCIGVTTSKLVANDAEGLAFAVHADTLRQTFSQIP